MNNKNNNMKHLLFYSNLCNYSQEVYNKITKFNIKDKFYLINISSNKYKIPSNIKSVPTILLNDKKTILIGNELNNFIDKLYNENKITIESSSNDDEVIQCKCIIKFGARKGESCNGKLFLDNKCKRHYNLNKK